MFSASHRLHVLEFNRGIIELKRSTFEGNATVICALQEFHSLQLMCGERGGEEGGVLGQG